MIAKRRFFHMCAVVSGLLTLASAIPASHAEECSQEMLMSYYPAPFVATTLEKFNVPQEKRAAIQQDLAEKDSQVVPLVEEKADRMDPNPLKDPKLRQQAVTIFRETLYDVFSNVLMTHGIRDTEQIQAMLDDIQEQKAKQFAACMEQFRPEGEPPRAGGNSPQGRESDRDPYPNRY